MISIFYMDIRAIGWSGFLQITTFAGASFYSLGPDLGKRGRRGIFGLRAGLGRCHWPAWGRAHSGEGAPHSIAASLAVAALVCGKTFSMRASRMQVGARSNRKHGF
jgi:hypothetical protein